MNRASTVVLERFAEKQLRKLPRNIQEAFLIWVSTVEKEVFDCAGRIGDLYLFTGVVESAQGGAGFHGVRTQFEGVICLKDATTAQLVSCKLFTPTRAA